MRPELPPEVIAAFWDKVDKDGPIFNAKMGKCWQWKGKKTKNGGVLYVAGRNNPAHRVSWKIANGMLARYQFLVQECGNRSCVNPDHLKECFVGRMPRVIDPSLNKVKLIGGPFNDQIRDLNDCRDGDCNAKMVEVTEGKYVLYKPDGTGWAYYTVPLLTNGSHIVANDYKKLIAKARRKAIKKAYNKMIHDLEYDEEKGVDRIRLEAQNRIQLAEEAATHMTVIVENIIIKFKKT